jgi:hypothetical protein
MRSMLGALLVVLLIPRALPAGQEPPATVKRAMAKLAKEPDNEEANLTVGKWFAFEVGDWERGVVHLVRGGDKLMLPVLEKDIAGTKDPKEMIAIGDEWLALSLKRQPKKGMQDRALYWFQQAWFLAQPEDKEALRRLFQRVYPPPPTMGDPPKGAAPAGWRVVQNPVVVDLHFARSGSASAKFTRNRVKAGVTILEQNRIQYTPVPKLKITFWAYAFGNAGLSLVFNTYGVDGERKLWTTMTVLSDAPFWRKYEREFEVSADAILLDIQIILGGTEGVVWLDDVSVKAENRELVRNGGFEEK